MPDWAYYQQNGKSPTMNLYEQTKKFKDEAIARLNAQEEAKRKEAEEKKMEKELEKQLEKKLGEALDKALADLLKDFK